MEEINIENGSKEEIDAYIKNIEVSYKEKFGYIRTLIRKVDSEVQEKLQKLREKYGNANKASENEKEEIRKLGITAVRLQGGLIALSAEGGHEDLVDILAKPLKRYMQE